MSPAPGVWEVLVESRCTSPVASTRSTLPSSVLGATVDPVAQELPTAAVGTAVPVTWTVQNGFGAMTGGGQGGDSARP